MALRYSKNTIGTFTLCQKAFDYADGKLVDVKDEKGRQVYNKFPIQIREGNCLAVFLHIYKQKEPENPKLPWRHELVLFFADDEHLKRCLKNNTWQQLFSGELRNIKLNMFYPESKVLLKHMTKAGLKVTCYYKEEK